MKIVLLGLLLPLSVFAQIPNYLQVLNSDRLELRAMSCSEDDAQLRARCVKDICGTEAPEFPMLIHESKLADFVGKFSGKLSPEKKEKVRADVLREAKRVRDVLERMKGMSPEDIAEEIEEPRKQEFVTVMLMEACDQQIDQNLPFDKRSTFVCSEKWKGTPQARAFAEGMESSMRNDLETGLMLGFYTFDEAVALVPSKLPGLRSSLADFKKSDDEQVKSIAEFMEKNWKNFSKLNYAGKVRFIKGLSKLAMTDGLDNACKVPACTQYFDDYLKTDAFRAELQKRIDQLNDPGLLETAVASATVKAIIAASAPDEATLKNLEGRKRETVKKILKAQKKIMSSHSFRTYEKAMKDVVVSYDESPYVDEWADVSDDVAFEHTLPAVLPVLGPTGDETLFGLIRASLGNEVALISDYYTDPKYNDFFDESFDKTRVKLSIFSIMEPDRGMQIFAHELGHHLSHMCDRKELSTATLKKLNDAKDCIKGRYSGKEGAFYLEEEFADEFAYMINDADTKALFCPVLASPDAKYSLEMTGTGDNHQTDFWRALTHLQNSGKPVSESCQKVLEQEAPKYSYKKCL